MNVSCATSPCPTILNSTCVFYEGGNLVYTGILTNDNLQIALEKIDQKFQDAGLGYIFNNGVIQTTPGAPVGLGGSLIQNTTITSGPYNLTITGDIFGGKFTTIGGTSSEFVKGDGSLDSTSYQVTGNYITALTGDGTASGPGTAVFTLDPISTPYAGTWGSATEVPRFTIDTKGRVISVSNVTITQTSPFLTFAGDVTGFGVTGAIVTLTLNTVNTGVFPAITPLKFSVNDKGLVTGASALTNLDLDAIYGYTPVPNTRTITINGVTQDLSVNRTWTISAGTGTVTSVGVTAGTGISASVSNPTTTPNITITNTAPDQIVSLSSGTGISVTGTYPNFTITNTGTVITPAALTKVDDTNVTLTLGGSPSTALLAATSLTLGWTGTLADSRIASAATWNAKQNAIALTTTGTSGAATFIGNTLNIPQYQAAGTYVTGVTATTPLASSGGTTPNITIQQASGSQSGYLSSTNWTTFNNKANYNTLTNTIPVFNGTIFANSNISNTALGIIQVNPFGLYIDVPNKLSILGDWGATGNSTSLFVDDVGQYVSVSTLSGVGTRMVVADSSGILSTQTIPSAGVTSVGATSPITSSGGSTPTISTSMSTNKLIGRSTVGTGVMEEISVGTGLSLSGGTLNATASVGFEQNFLLMGA